MNYDTSKIKSKQYETQYYDPQSGEDFNIFKSKKVKKDNTGEGNNVSLINGNDTYKRETNSELNISKEEAKLRLSQCTYKTPPKDVANLLENIFRDWQSKDGHWLWVAQRWTPRPINRVLTRMRKQARRGDITIKNPAAYFTHLIKRRKKRVIFKTSTSDTRTQEGQS